MVNPIPCKRVAAQQPPCRQHSPFRWAELFDGLDAVDRARGEEPARWWNERRQLLFVRLYEGDHRRLNGPLSLLLTAFTPFPAIACQMHDGSSRRSGHHDANCRQQRPECRPSTARKVVRPAAQPPLWPDCRGRPVVQARDLGRTSTMPDRCPVAPGSRQEVRGAYNHTRTNTDARQQQPWHDGSQAKKNEYQCSSRCCWW